MTQSIDRGMNLGTLFALMAVVTRAGSALRGGLKGSSIKDHRRRFRVPATKQPQHLAQIVGHGFKAACLDPNAGLAAGRYTREADRGASSSRDNLPAPCSAEH